MIKQKLMQINSMPDNQRIHITDFAGGFCGTVGEFKREFRCMRNMKMNRNLVNVGRCYDQDYQRNMIHDARAINNYFKSRIIARGTIATDIFVKRYGRYFLMNA